MSEKTEVNFGDDANADLVALSLLTQIGEAEGLFRAAKELINTAQVELHMLPIREFLIADKGRRMRVLGVATLTSTLPCVNRLRLHPGDPYRSICEEVLALQEKVGQDQDIGVILMSTEKVRSNLRGLLLQRQLHRILEVEEETITIPPRAMGKLLKQESQTGQQEIEKWGVFEGLFLKYTISLLPEESLEEELLDKLRDAAKTLQLI